MKTNEITAADYQRTMNSVWSVVRGYCSDDEEAANTITMAVENYLYDRENGLSEMKAIRQAIDELYIESDYMMDFAEGIVALNVEPAWETDDDNDDEFDVEDDADVMSFAEIMELKAMRELSI